MEQKRLVRADHDRRGFLRLGAGAVVTGAFAMLGESPARSAVSNRALSFNNLHTGESLDVTYWADGHPIPDALASVDHILRDFRTGEIHPIDLRLLNLLVRVQHALDTTEPFQIISGYRSPATNRTLASHGSGVARRSLHMQGMAIDVRVQGRSLEALHRAAVAQKFGGVGMYPKSDFVHMDTGRVRYW